MQLILDTIPWSIILWFLLIRLSSKSNNLINHVSPWLTPAEALLPLIQSFLSWCLETGAPIHHLLYLLSGHCAGGGGGRQLSGRGGASSTRRSRSGTWWSWQRSWRFVHQLSKEFNLETIRIKIRNVQSQTIYN